MKNKVFWSIFLVLILIIVGLFLLGDGIDKFTDTEPDKQYERPNKTLADRGDSVTFHVAQAGDTWPKILEATVDPPKVAVGDIQKMRVVAESPAGINSVTARIQTDSGFVNVDLERVESGVQVMDNPFKVEGNKVTGFYTDKELESMKNSNGRVATARAQISYDAEVWEGQWEVNDTHTKEYETEFIVTDNEGRQNSTKIGWLDPACSIPASGDWTWSSGTCTVYSLDGVAGGDANLNGGSLTIAQAVEGSTTLVKFIIEGALNLNGGTVNIEEQYVELNFNDTLYVEDQDFDGYPGHVTQWDSSGSGHEQPRHNLNSWDLDCEDSLATVNPGQTSWFDYSYTDSGGNPSFDWNCDNNEEYRYTATAGKNFCDGTDAYGWQLGGTPYCGNTGYWIDCYGGQCAQPCPAQRVQECR